MKPIPFPPVNPNPAARVTRLGHVVQTVRDLGATRAFYEGVLGFEVTDQTEDALYLRGIEERGHHSLVFERDSGVPRTRRVGWRLFEEEDVRAAPAAALGHSGIGDGAVEVRARPASMCADRGRPRVAHSRRRGSARGSARGGGSDPRGCRPPPPPAPCSPPAPPPRDAASHRDTGARPRGKTPYRPRHGRGAKGPAGG